MLWGCLECDLDVKQTFSCLLQYSQDLDGEGLGTHVGIQWPFVLANLILSRPPKSPTLREEFPNLNVFPFLPKMEIGNTIPVFIYFQWLLWDQGWMFPLLSLPGAKGAFVLGGSWGLESSLYEENMVFLTAHVTAPNKRFFLTYFKNFPIKKRKDAVESCFSVAVLELDT